MAYEDKDPRTVAAIEKIKAILRENDLWACMSIVSEERSHWLYCFDPSWSCLDFNSETGAARMRAKRADFATAEQHQRVINLTAGAIIETGHMALKTVEDMSTLITTLKGAGIEIEHTRGDLEVKKT